MASQLQNYCHCFSYRPRDSCMNSETYHYKRGANQTFAQSTHIVDPSKFPEEDVSRSLSDSVVLFTVQENPVAIGSPTARS